MFPLTTALVLFPFLGFDRIDIGPYGLEVQSEPVPLTALDPTALSGLELRYRHGGGDEALKGVLLGSSMGLLRLGLNDAGAVQLDQLRLEAGLCSVKVRRNLGDRLDLAFIGGDWDRTFEQYASDRIWYRGYTPNNLTLLGFSDTDGDDDRKLKYYISIGSGVGGELGVQVVGPLALYIQTEGMARTMNRHRAEVPNQVRHEIAADASAGLSWQGEALGGTLSGWTELVSQWETRDSDAKSGVDRQQLAWGARLTIRNASAWTSYEEISPDEDTDHSGTYMPPRDESEGSGTDVPPEEESEGSGTYVPPEEETEGSGTYVPPE